jgi:predicted DNA-binding protein (UPF0251 family)
LRIFSLSLKKIYNDMPRQKQLRKIFAPPNFKGFKPYGCPKGCKGSVDLLYEEYEAIKMADYDLLTYEEAAILMGISRATFARICENARRKISRAMVEGKEIKAVYGNVRFEKEWFLCNDCYARFNIYTPMAEDNCPECHSVNISSLNIHN